ncbi:MAG: nucleotide exchange factor GrpE [Pyrinomonadaceae bacterium]
MAKDFFGKDRKDARDEAAEIRVTDRRRIQLEDSGDRAPEASPESPNLRPTYVEELETRTKAAEQKALEVQVRFEELRKQLQKETDETRQRLNRAADERTQREKADFIASLLPVLDNLQRAAEAAETSDSTEVIAEGIRRTASSFESALAAAGVEPIEALGQPFDPQLHEAVEVAEVEPEEAGKVVGQYARGYKISDQLLRPAQVKVGRNREKASQAFE